MDESRANLGVAKAGSFFAQDRINVSRDLHYEGKQFVMRVNVPARVVARFKFCHLHDFTEALARGSSRSREARQSVFQPVLFCRLGMWQAMKFETRFHGQTIAPGCNCGNAFCLPWPVFMSGRCDISAERFVARQSRWADTACNEEAAFSRLRFHAPMHCIGETHVPLGIF
jgi:hypothetical protein